MYDAVYLRRANPVWLDPFCRNLELAAQADHEDDLPENLSEITDLWNSPARTHVSNIYLSSCISHNNTLRILIRLDFASGRVKPSLSGLGEFVSVTVASPPESTPLHSCTLSIFLS